jgi:hypothetical protein
MKQIRSKRVFDEIKVQVLLRERNCFNLRNPVGVTLYSILTENLISQRYRKMHLNTKAL